MKLKAVIFDWDGTLMDSIAKIVATMQQAARDANVLVPSEKAVKDIIGLSLPKAIAILFPDCSEQKQEELIAGYKHCFVNVIDVETPLFVGVEDMLDCLLERGVKLAVATGKARQGLNAAFKKTGLAQKFSASRCADETHSKPDPMMLNEILAELSVDPESAVMIGDSRYDLQMANNAGIRGIGITLGVHSQEELIKENPSNVAHSITELKTILLNSL